MSDESKISMLTFSRDDIDAVQSLIDSMYDFVEDIVLIDSSNTVNHKKLLKIKKDNKLSKLRIFKTVALGMPDPLFMYGNKKCRYEWIIKLDSDERPNLLLRTDLKEIIENNHSSAFGIEEKESGLTVTQVRLYRKSKAIFKGLVHEQPSINGKISMLPGKYYIDHKKEIGSNSWREYGKFDKYERFNYGLFNSKVAEYIYKTTFSHGENTITFKLLKIYEKLGRKSPEKELSNLDYFLWYLFRETWYWLNNKNHTLPEFFHMLLYAKHHADTIKEWRKAPDSDEIFEISKIIHKIGITKFLGLDNEETVSRYNAKHSNSKQGVELLMNLLKERYEKKCSKDQQVKSS